MLRRDSLSYGLCRGCNKNKEEATKKMEKKSCARFCVQAVKGRSKTRQTTFRPTPRLTLDSWSQRLRAIPQVRPRPCGFCSYLRHLPCSSHLASFN
ncbi:hypothetical protein E2C01_032148 [Portunus trituberculatus]|uniref:Uncharacterized protein n=1 Tax=Portunus trituberculatus TaxID=210409 RepID=A0A5B7EZK6_PORTR|nr:hypothetical protein [Portunus trituberculatus]